MNKRGGIIIPLVTVCAILILLYAISSIYSGENKPGTEKIGNLQLSIIELQQEAEGKLFYLDQIVKYSAKKTAEELRNKQFTSNNEIIDTFSKRFEEEFKKNLLIAYFEVPVEYKFDYKYEANTVKIRGDAEKEIVLKSEFATYGVEHDFIHEIKFENVKTKSLFES